MKSYVVDASVILRSILPPDHTSTVPQRLRRLFKQADTDKSEIASIPLLMIEIANGLRFHWTDPQLAQASMAQIKRLPIRIIPFTSEQIEDALMLSYKLQTTVYDTCYHLLARLLDATFITCDRRYFEKAKRLGNIELW